MYQGKPLKFSQPVSNGNHKQSNQEVLCPQNLYSFENNRPHSQKEQFKGNYDQARNQYQFGTNINDKIKTEPNEELNQSLQQNQKQFHQKYFQQQQQNLNESDQKLNYQPSQNKPKEPDLVLQQQLQGKNQQQIKENQQQNSSKNSDQSQAEPQQENLEDVFKQYFLFNQNQIDPRTEHLLVSLNQGSNKNSGFTSKPDLDVQDLEFLNIKVLNHFKYKPRPVQFLALIELYNQQNDKGRLAQIYTGEGKSLIIAMLAVCLVKKKKVNVDIVTSSPVLAQRDAEKLSSFYQLFDIKASHNVTDEIKNTCYKCQIVYGDPSSFEGDILRHEYSELNTMEDRKLNYIIVDEVDSMLIDGNSNKTILTSPKPGMLDVTKVLRLIWDEICKVEPQLSTDLKVMIIDKNDFYSVDLIEYIEKTLQIQIDTAIFKYLPKFRNSYVNSMKTDWIKNAIQAKFQIQENKNYIVENNKIRIVDFQNTGVIHLDTMQWQRGLHQFIQMKHKIPITPLTISTNFLSNVGFFTRYSAQLLGLTGTLGSKATQNLLAQQYKVDFVFIPPNKTRQIQIYEPIVVFNEREWQQAILKAVTEVVQTHRAVLIINQTIKEVNTLGQLIKNNNIQCIQYSDNSQTINMNITQQQVIVATNLAGRGTDLVTDENLEQSGGLHVILSFLPRNVRIQEQAIGRTGRQGRKGSAQLILNFNDFISQNKLTQQEFQLLNIKPFEFMKSIRDEREIKYAEGLKIEMDKLLNEDKCFSKFCQVAKSKANLKKEPAAFSAIEERWGIYLEQNKGNLNEGEIEQIINSTEDENPKYLIQKGLEKNSIEMYNRAIQISENDPYAYYYKGMQEVKNNQLQDAAKDLLKARELLQNKIEDEKGFQLALKLNQNVIETFQLPKDFGIDEKQKSIQIDEVETKNQNPLFENNNGLLNKNRQELNSNRIEQNSNRSQQKSNSISQNKNTNNSLQLLDQKFNNQIKVYNKLLQNIEENLQAIQSFNPKEEEVWVKWTPMLTEQEKKNPNLSQEVKDREEIVADGPLPKMGEVRKKKKEPKASSLWLIIFGVVQVVAGLAICAFTGGAALPIGKALIEEGVSDIVTGTIAVWKGEEIDWEVWRNRKTLRLATAIAMAGTAGIREIVEMGKKFAKSFQQIGLKEMLKSLPQVTVKGLQNAGLYIPAVETKQLSNSIQAIEKIEKVAFSASSLKEISLLTGQVLNNQVDLGLLSSDEASQLQEIVSMSLNEASSTKGCASLFGNLAKNYLQVKIARDRLNKNNDQSKTEVTQLCQQKNQEMFEQKKANLHRYKQYKNYLQNELRQLSQFMWICFQNDSRATNILLGFDLFFEKVDQQKVKDILAVDKFRMRLNSQFDITNHSLVETLKKLVISDKKQIEQLYVKFVKPIVHSLFENFKCLNEQQPLEILFFQSFDQYFTREKNNLDNAQLSLDEEKKQIERKQQYLAKSIDRLKQNVDWIKRNEKNQQQMINQLNLIKIEFQNINEELSNQLNQAINSYNQKLNNHKNLVTIFNSNNEIRTISKNAFQFLMDKKFIKDDEMPNRNQIFQGLDLYFKIQCVEENKIKLIQQIMQNAFAKMARIPKQLFSGPFKEAVEMEIIYPIKQFLNDFRIEQAQKQV